MAKEGKSVKLGKCYVDLDNGVFVEEIKDGQLTYSIMDDILKKFDKMSDVSISITWAEEILPNDEVETDDDDDE